MPSADEKNDKIYNTTVRIPGEIKGVLRKLAKRYELTQSEIIIDLLELCEENDLLRKNWQDRLDASLTRGWRKIENKEYDTDLNRCPAITKGEEKFKCVWGRKGKPPIIRLLAKEYGLSKNVCAGCEKTLLIKAENEGYLKQIKQLEFKLQARSEMIYKLPVCEAVGILNSDSTLFSRCQEYNMRAVNIEKFCKIKNNGNPCSWYKESIVGVGEKIK